MAFIPEPGLVILYDFIWKHEQLSGLEDGVKDARPCLIMDTKSGKEPGLIDVLICPISHRPPDENIKAVDLPQDVAKQLGLDNQRMWIKPHAVNDQVFYSGFNMPRAQQEPLGMMRDDVSEKVIDVYNEHVQSKAIEYAKREPDAYTQKLSQVHSQEKSEAQIDTYAQSALDNYGELLNESPSNDGNSNDGNSR